MDSIYRKILYIHKLFNSHTIREVRYKWHTVRKGIGMSSLEIY
ncbi:hypothetical protein HS7_15530 [Sulfolobales archaeon HS-7]|nr:hypothetical protein HS7_15530 [Sulfolobales archaeon HS-7]